MSNGQIVKILAQTSLNRSELQLIKLSAPARMGIVSRISIHSDAFLTVSIGSLTAESQVVVNLVATVESGTADTWEWRQTSGPAVTLTGTGGTRAFTAPATVDGASLSFQVRASQTSPAQTSSWVTATITVRAQSAWVKRAAGWVPASETDLP